jgi:tRNA A-37 threonylcarbamoyl transferase component Bud32
MTQNNMDLHVLKDIRKRDSSWWEINKERMYESRRRDLRHFTHQAIQNGIESMRKRRRYKTFSTRPNSDSCSLKLKIKLQ